MKSKNKYNDLIQQTDNYFETRNDLLHSLSNKKSILDSPNEYSTFLSNANYKFDNFFLEKKKKLSIWQQDSFKYLSLSLSHPGVEKELSNFLADKFNKNTTIFDRTIDLKYNQTGVGGSVLHHNLDGSHTWEGAFKSLSEAYPNDNDFILSLHSVNHLFNDWMTPSGINPFLNPDDFISIKDFLKDNLGLSASASNDFLNFNCSEAFTASIVAISLLLDLNDSNLEKISEYATRITMCSFFSGNPILLGIGIFLLGKSLKILWEDKEYEQVIRGSCSGLFNASAFFALSSLHLPLLISIGLGITASIIVDRALNNIFFSMSRFDETLQVMFKDHRSYYNLL